jgi:hypothetical protein
LDLSLLRDSAHHLEQTYYDTWNGSAYSYTLTLNLPPSLYASLSEQIQEKEKFLAERLAQLMRTYPNDILTNVILVPSLDLEKRKPPSQLALDSPKFWEEGYFRLFITHISEIKEHASNIQGLSENWGSPASLPTRTSSLQKNG